MKNQHATAPRSLTARRRIATVLTQEIIDRSETKSFRLSSEYQLCHRFNVSRVTIRLALTDLENRGLIYRQQGKGTFAHGRSTRVHRHIGVLAKTSLATENKALSDFLRGVLTFVRPMRSTIILIGHSPGEWGPELAGVLAGVIVMAENVTSDDLDDLSCRRLPFLMLGETELPCPRLTLDDFNKPITAEVGDYFFRAGHDAAEALTRAFLAGETFDNFSLSPTYGRPACAFPKVGGLSRH